ncbi:hypothetical protein [Nocardia grenadensis]|uniref:hypothetical protein n=1 Tax=Nocardia grenadensis TaxID=931537 RepID=UPI003D8CA725
MKHALVAYFQPSYNKNVKRWPATAAAAAFDAIGSAGILVGYEGTRDIAYLFSKERPAPRRGIVFYSEFRGLKRQIDVDEADTSGIPEPVFELGYNLARHSDGSPPGLRLFN